MAAATFKRMKIVKLIRKYKAQAEQAKKEFEDYEIRKRTAVGGDSERYYTEMASLYHGKYVGKLGIANDLAYEFGVSVEELNGGGE